MSELLKQLPGLNIYQFQNHAMLILRFSFEGHRNLCASHLASSLDLATELERSAAMLNRCYPGKRIRAIEIAAYERGSFDYFTWPEGLEVLKGFEVATILDEATEDLENSAGSPVGSKEEVQ